MRGKLLRIDRGFLVAVEFTNTHNKSPSPLYRQKNHTEIASPQVSINSSVLINEILLLIRSTSI